MGCTSAKQVSTVPNSEEGGQNKSHSNGELLSGQSLSSHYPVSIMSQSLISNDSFDPCVKKTLRIFKLPLKQELRTGQCKYLALFKVIFYILKLHLIHFQASREMMINCQHNLHGAHQGSCCGGSTWVISASDEFPRCILIRCACWMESGGSKEHEPGSDQRGLTADGCALLAVH